MRAIDLFEGFRVSIGFVHHHVVVRHLLVARQRRRRTSHCAAALQEGEMYRQVGFPAIRPGSRPLSAAYCPLRRSPENCPWVCCYPVPMYPAKIAGRTSGEAPSISDASVLRFLLENNDEVGDQPSHPNQVPLLPSVLLSKMSSSRVAARKRFSLQKRF